jgi:hypothetical protein
MSDIVATNSIPISGTDGAIVAYGGSIVVNVVVKTVGGSDLIIYDNASAASGTVLGVVSHSAGTGVYPIDTTTKKGVYLSGSSGWVGSVGLSS